MRRRVARCAEPSDSSSDLPTEIQSVDRETPGSNGENLNSNDTNKDSTEESPTVLVSLQNAICASWFNLLLVFVPMGYLAYYLEWPVVAVFVLNYLAIIPLSALMGFATEEVSLRLGTTWGGVVNAVFGNIVELLVAVIALIEKEYRIVQAGLIGSVLSNTLLVLGLVFTAGGLYHRVQLFHAEAAQCAGSLLALSVLSMIIPAAYHGVHAEGGEITNGILVMSRGTALILLLVYILFLVFQLKTHSEIFDGTHAGDILAKEEMQSRELDRHNLELSRTLTSNHSQDALWVAVALLLAVSAMVALSSDVLVDSVEELTTSYAISHTFVGMILLPIAANAAEHAMSMTVAVRDKMDLCITIAVGSSMQIALFVLPVLIIIAWIMNRPLTLFFDDFETTTMLISVLVINYLIMNGRSNWLKGTMLLSSYLIVALAFFLYPSEIDNLRETVSTSSR
ncbi:calcium/proton exchanger [Coemansia reversa NRRL 1564]|uniref:Vacuolar calcium ion transporter n=1 Tax=Coemansia reversa (strain ATCC 12441 / NRRL 1564) TaxID=763665 RepID=A0A2G5BEH7_COERN|nr:calcium/proton exchanger [Coemansia reversa NRRL 1564]|eukprot:PIA17419.1 calcium/proton exchanger [Coemansia reversa NRRL 1564]